MLVLLAALPYVSAIALYWLTANDLVADADGEIPSNWNWRLVAPVMVAGFTPLALATSEGVSSSDRNLLISATAVAMFFTAVFMTALRDKSGFFRIQRPISVNSVNFTRLARWKAIVAIGTVILCYGAVVNVFVAAKTDSGDASEQKTLREGAAPVAPSPPSAPPRLP